MSGYIQLVTTCNVHVGVPVNFLAQIWDLSDTDKDNNLSEPEFAVAMHLIMAVLAGQELPAVLPQALVQSVAAVSIANSFFLTRSIIRIFLLQVEAELLHHLWYPIVCLTSRLLM